MSKHADRRLFTEIQASLRKLSIVIKTYMDRSQSERICCVTLVNKVMLYLI